MSSIKVRHSTAWTIENQETGETFEVEYEPIEHMDAEFEKLPGGYTLVGYFSDDPDVGNPLNDCDGLGHIYRRSNRDASPKERAKFYAAIGYNAEGERDESIEPAKHFVFLDKYDHSGVLWSVAGEGMDDRWDTSHKNGVWVPDESVLDHIRDAAVVRWFEEHHKITVEHGHPSGVIAVLPSGTKTIKLSSYKQLGVHISNLFGVAITKEMCKEGERLAAEREARIACDLYNDWIAGNCYAMNAEVFDANGNKVGDTEETGGAVGEDHARDVLKDVMHNARVNFEHDREQKPE